MTLAARTDSAAGVRENGSRRSHAGTIPGAGPEAPASIARWAWLPIPVFILLIAGLWASGTAREAAYESTPLFLALTLVFGLLVSLLMAFLLGRSFVIHRAPELLLIALGAIFWGTAGFSGAVAGAIQGEPGYANTVATVYNVAVWLSALCHLIGATLPLRWRRPLASPLRWLAGCYSLAIAIMIGLVLVTMDGHLPVFFIAGEGGTLARELVLYSAIAMLVVTGLLFTREPPQRGNAFKFLYGHALLLLAVGIVGLLTGGPGTLLAWAGRSAHAFGSVYMLVGVVQTGRLQRARGLLADLPADEGRLGYAVAVAMVVAAAAIRVVLFPTMGDRFVFTIFYPALAFATLYGGWRAGFVATALAALIVTYFWIEPVGTLFVKEAADWAGIVIFLATGAMVSVMADRMRLAEAQARRAEALVAAQRDRLDELIQARTASLEQEIAERIRTEEALRTKEAELTEAQRVAGLGNWYWDAGTGRISASDGMLAIYGRESIPPLAEQAGAIHPVESWKKLESAYKEAISTGSGYDIELQAWRGDGKAIWIEARAEAVLDTSGKVVGLRGTVQDITKRKQAEEAWRQSEIRLHTLTQHAPAAIAVFDRDMRYLAVSRRWLDDHGIGDQDVIGKSHYDISPGLPEIWREAHRRGLAGEILHGEADRLELADGSVQWISWEIWPWRDSVGNIGGIIIAAEEITERVKAEEKLRESEGRYRALFNNRTSAIAHHRVVADQDGKPADYYIEAINDTYEQILGVKREQVEGKLVSEVLPDVRDFEFDPISTFGKIGLSGGEGSFEVYFPPNRQWLSVYAYSPKIGEFTAIFTDITRQKEAEAAILRLNADLEKRVLERTMELQRANDALLHTNADLQHFAHATAHDLQTPLRSIAGFTQLVQQEVHGRVDKRVDEWSALVVANTRRLQSLIQELVTYTRLDVQGLPFERVDLETLFAEVADSLGTLIADTGARVSHSELPTVLADRTQIAQVLQNLVENGIKYNKSRPPEVTVAGDRQDDGWIFSVTDNGIGIDPRHHERIFEIFHRLHSYSQVPGSGIGLALSRRIVERHGGRMWVESRPGKGSTFFFSLPCEGEDRSAVEMPQSVA